MFGIVFSIAEGAQPAEQKLSAELQDLTGEAAIISSGNIGGNIAGNSLASKPALPPAVIFDSNTSQPLLVLDSSAVWGDWAVWGNSVPANGSAALWGSQGFSTLWGTSAVWTASTTNRFGSLNLSGNGTGIWQ